MSRRSGQASGSLAKRPCGSFSPVAVARYSPSGPLSLPDGLRVSSTSSTLDRHRRQRWLAHGAGGERRGPVVRHLRPAERAAEDRAGRPGRSSAPVSAASRPSGASRSSAWASSTSSALSPTARTRSTSAAGATQPPACVGSASSGAAAPRTARGRPPRSARSRCGSRAWTACREPRRRDVQHAARVALRVEPAQMSARTPAAACRTARRSGAGPRP